MLVAGMPAQTITDLATLAGIVKEMKAGKIADALIDLGRQMEELKDFSTELNALRDQLKKESQSLTARENALGPAEKKIAEDKKSLKDQLEIVRKAREEIDLQERSIKSKLKEAEDTATKMVNDARDMFRRAEEVKAKAEVTLQSAREKEAEWETRIKRLQEAAMNL